MSRSYRFLALSDHWLARSVRSLYRGILQLSLPAPRWITMPVLGLVVGVREITGFVRRVFWCEPLFKSYCSEYGKNLKTGVFLHWVQGRGRLVVGDHVTLDGKSTFIFAVRYSDDPCLEIGSHTGIGHNCAFVVGKRISIGSNCRIAYSVQMFDTPGHPMDPETRKAGLPARNEDVQPIVIEDNVWIGSSSIVYPGVRIGQGSVVAAGSVVMNNVPANTVVAGNPARQIRNLAKIE